MSILEGRQARRQIAVGIMHEVQVELARRVFQKLFEVIEQLYTSLQGNASSSDVLLRVSCEIRDLTAKAHNAKLDLVQACCELGLFMISEANSLNILR